MVSGAGSREAGKAPYIALGAGREFDLIRRFLERAGPLPDAVRVGPGDDCAVIAGEGVAISTDLSVEGIHFRRAWLEPEEIGYRAAAAALSDLAAVAARPIGVLVSLMLPVEEGAAETAGPLESPQPASPGDPAPELPSAGTVGVALMEGVRGAAASVGAALLGGDVSRSPGPLALDVVAVGEAARPVLRSGAAAGDELWVTGQLGAAAAAVACWTRGDDPGPKARAAFARPRPRIAEARWLAERGLARALIDLSDGLAGDAGHVAAASGVAAVIEPDRVPVHPAALAAAGQESTALRWALAGGEDYELLLATAPGVLAPLAAEFEAVFDLRLTRVGELESGRGVYARQPDGTRAPLELGGYDHFQGDDR